MLHNATVLWFQAVSTRTLITQHVEATDNKLAVKNINWRRYDVGNCRTVSTRPRNGETVNITAIVQQHCTVTNTQQHYNKCR